VQPARRHLANSISTGMGLTLATAGVRAVMTLTVKDRHDNWQPSGTVVTTAGMSFSLTDKTQITSYVISNCASPSANTYAGDCPSRASGNFVAVPTTGDKATFTMRYEVTKSGVYSLALQGSNTHDPLVKDAPFPLTVFPHLPCATTSTATSDALTLVTSGIAATYTIQSRDKFYNTRGTHVGDNFVSFIRMSSSNKWRDHHATVVDNADSTYTLSFTATKSTTNQLWAQLAMPGNLIATSYNGASGTTPGLNELLTGAAFSMGSSAVCYTGQSPAGACNKKFKGFIRPSNSGTYSFKLSSGAQDENIRVYIDNYLVFDYWSATAPAATTSSTTMVMVANRLYDLSLEYKTSGTGARQAKLEYIQGGVAAASFPTDRIFTAAHITGSPFTVTVKPAIACATTSTKEQMAISLSTAGLAASFTIQSKDQFGKLPKENPPGNLREISGDPWDFALMSGSTVPTGSVDHQDHSKDGGTVKFQGTATYTTNGGYRIQYTATEQGRYNLRAKLMQPGGLYAEYFENDDLTDHGEYGGSNTAATMAAFHRIDAKVDFDWKDGQPVNEAADEFSNWNGKKKIGPDFFSARWTGMIKPVYSEVYTFSAEVDDGIKVWLDDLLIMSYWDSRNNEVDGTIALLANQLYNIKIEYKDVTGNATIRFRWKSKTQTKEVVPSGSLYHTTTSRRLSEPNLDVEPTVVCGSTSHAWGEGLTIATAGYTSYFTVQSRDEYNNKRRLGDSPDFHVRIVPVVSGLQRPYHAGLYDLATAGVNRLASEDYPGGLTATYYDTDSWGTPKTVSCMQKPWHNPLYCNVVDMTKNVQPASGKARVLGMTTLTNLVFSVRYKGFIRPSKSGAYKFFLSKVAANNNEASLEIGGTTVIASATGADISGAVTFPTANKFYDIQIKFKQGTGSATQMKLILQATQNTGASSGTLVPSDRLFPLAGRYKVHYTPTVKGDYSVHASVAHPGGLDATFYESMQLTEQSANMVASTVDWSTSDYSDTSLPRKHSSGTDDPNSISARYQGFYKPSATAATFRVVTNEVDERVKLWVDNSLIIDRWDTYDAVTGTTATAMYTFSATAKNGVQLGDTNSLFDIKLEYKQFAGEAGLTLQAHNGAAWATVASTSLFYVRDISGSPFPPHEIMPAATCAAKSTVRGPGLSEATAGIPNSFTIQSHDQYNNERGVQNNAAGQRVSDIYEVRLAQKTCEESGTCPMIYATVVDLQDSSYVATYNGTRRGTYDVITRLATPNAISATYYTSTGFGGATTIATKAHATHTGGNPTVLRFQGYVKPPTSGTYTFHVDHTITGVVPDLWVRDSTGAGSKLTVTGSKTATITLPSANTLYDIKVNYNGNAATTVSLKWTYGGGSTSVLPTDRIFAIDEVPNSVTHTMFFEGTDAATSHTSGNGLTIATAGWVASFTITSKDSFANRREVDEDTYLIQVVGPGATHTLRGVHDARPEANAGAHNGVGPGRYHVTYTTTQTGMYNVNVLRGFPGGLKAEYFNNMWLLGNAAHSGIDQQINYEWGTSTVQPSSVPSGVVLGSDYMSVRWSGYIMPELSEEYTFYTETDEGVRLWVNDVKLIDKWDVSSQNHSATWSGFTVGALYSVKMEYKESTDAAFAKLLYSSDSIAKQPVPVDVLFHKSQHIWGSPFKLYVYPAITCAATSTVDGPGLSFGTTGNTASFTIQAKDEYHNVKTKWVAGSDEIFHIRSRVQDSSDYSKIGTVTHNIVKGKWNTVYQPTKCGSSEIYASMIDIDNGVGLMATYYQGTGTSKQAKKVASVTDIASSDIGTDGGTTGALTTRWSGFFKPTSSGIYSFNIERDGQAGVRLYVHNKLIADKWATASSDVSGSIFFHKANDYYDLKVEYWHTSGSSASARIKYGQAAAPSTNMVTSKLFKDLPISNSPYVYVTKPDVTAWSTSTITGEALTIATAGVTSQFTVQSKDANDNNRDSGGDDYLMHAASATGAALSGTVTDNSDGTYIIKYTPSRQGAYSLKVYLGTSDMTTALHVEPGAGCASKSVANSEQLSIATAGHMATFTVQAKDQYKNLRTISSNDWIVRLTGPDGEEHNNGLTYRGATLVDHLGKWDVNYRTSKSGAFKINLMLADGNGLQGNYYRDDSLSNVAHSTVDSTVDFNWGADTPHSSVGVVDGFSASWTGYVKPATTQVHTFSVGIAEVDERVKLWVDDHYIIDKWTSEPGSTTLSGTLKLNENTLYDIKMYYKETSGNSEVQLSWKYGASSAVIPSTKLYATSHHIAGSPFSTTVFPTLTSGAISTVAGPGLSLATAGVTASFTITAKDSLGNLKTTNDDLFVVRARHQGSTSKRDIQGTVTPVGDGKYSVVYTPTYKQHHESWHSTPAGPYHDVFTSLAKPGGLTATFYQTNTLSGIGYVSVTEQVTRNAKPAGVTGDDWSAKYAGFFRPQAAEMYTFKLTKGTNDAVTLKVDGKTLALSSDTAVMQFMEANGFYDVDITWTTGNDANADSIKLEYKSNAAGAYSVVPSDRLFQRQDLTFKIYEDQGLLATYYTGVVGTGTQKLVVVDPTVDWSGATITDRPHRFTVDSGDFGVRWEGFVKPSRRDRYTFYVASGNTGTGETVKLWVDNVQIMNGLHSATEHSATIQFPEANDVYDIKLEYDVTSSETTRAVTLKWENAGTTYSSYGITSPTGSTVAKGVIPSDRLFRARATPTINRDDFAGSHWTYGANGCLGIVGKSDEARYRECRGLGIRTNDVLHVDVKPAVVCSAQTVLNDAGSQMTVTTAGSTRTFDITVKDEYGNIRDTVDQALMARQIVKVGTPAGTAPGCCGSSKQQYAENPFKGTVAVTTTGDTDYDPSGHFRTTYLVTRAGTFWQDVSLADVKGNGLFGTYFQTNSLSGGAVTRIDANVDFNWGRGAPTADGLIPADNFSVRWVGYIKPEFTEVYTFYVRSDDGSKLWVDNSLLFDKWTAAPGLEHSGTVSMSANVVHDIKLEYKEGTDNAFVELKYSSPSTQKTVVPSSRLFPSKNTILNGRNTLTVHHTVISATVSTVNGPGLTIATTGVMASFTIESKDMYGNSRSKQDAGVQDCPSAGANCMFNMRITPDDTSLSKRAHIGTVNHQAGAGNSYFTGKYTYTLAGSHNVYVSYQKTGGLLATYYDDTNFAIPRKATTGQTGMISSLTGTTTPASLVDDGLYSVRWTGMYTAAATATTFALSSPESVKVWFDDVLIIDKWPTGYTNGANTVVSNTVVGARYALKVEFKSDSTAGTGLTSATINGGAWATGSFVESHPISGEPKRLLINPNIACGTTSRHTGYGLSIATAGIQASFTVTCKDDWENERGKGGDVFMGRAFPLGCAVDTCAPFEHGSSGSCTSCPTIVRGAVTDKNDNTYSVVYTPTKKGDYKVVSSLARVGGLSATYYTNAGSNMGQVLTQWSSATANQLATNAVVDFSSTATNANWLVGGAAEGGARWQGFIQPSKAAQYTFFVSTPASSDGKDKVRVWVDNSLIISATTVAGIGGGKEVSGTIGFGNANALYDIQVGWNSRAAADNKHYGITLKWQSDGSQLANDNVAKGRLPTYRMYNRHDVDPKNYLNVANPDLIVHPAVGCATKSTATGNPLTLATAGAAATFTVTAKDAYENDRTKTDDMAWVVTLHGSGGTPTYQASVAQQGAGTNTYKVSYTASIAKAYESFVKYNNDNSHGSPFSLNLKPNLECGSKATASGSGLTTATVNSAAAFSIQARDEYGNAKTSAVAATSKFLVRVVYSAHGSDPAISDQSGTRGTGTTVTLPSSNSGGLYTGTYTLTGAPAGSVSAFVHASMGVQGSLLATYYKLSSIATTDFDNGAGATALRVAMDTMTTQSGSACTTAGVCGSNTHGATGTFGIRYAGFVKPAGASLAMSWGTGSTANHRFRIFWEHQLQTLQKSAGTANGWSSNDLSDVTLPLTGLSTSRYYEVFYEYRGPVGGSERYWHIKNVGDATATMWARHDVSGSPFGLTVTS